MFKNEFIPREPKKQAFHSERQFIGSNKRETIVLTNKDQTFVEGIQVR